MFEQVLPWIGLGVLFLLCLPIPPFQKFVLELSTWSLRLGMVALLAVGAYLWFRPGTLPAEVSSVFADFPRLLALLPDQTAPQFGLCVSCLLVAALVPILAAVDAGRRASRVGNTVREQEPANPPRKQVVEEVEEVKAVEHPQALPEAQEIEDPLPVGVPLLRPIERREAAGAIASAGSRRPTRSAN